MPTADHLAAEIMDRCDVLATYTEEPGRITRPYGTPALAAARDRVAAWMQEAGMTTRVDNVGNLFGRYEAAPGAPRPYPARPPAVCYPAGAVVRRVSSGGTIRWRQYRVFLSSNLAGEDVCLTPTDAELLAVRYAALKLGDLDPVVGRFRPDVRWLG